MQHGVQLNCCHFRCEKTEFSGRTNNTSVGRKKKRERKEEVVSVLLHPLFKRHILYSSFVSAFTSEQIHFITHWHLVPANFLFHHLLHTYFQPLFSLAVCSVLFINTNTNDSEQIITFLLYPEAQNLSASGNYGCRQWLTSRHSLFHNKT